MKRSGVNSSLGGEIMEIGRTCPNCGAPLTANADGSKIVCEYCHTVLVDNAPKPQPAVMPAQPAPVIQPDAGEVPLQTYLQRNSKWLGKVGKFLIIQLLLTSFGGFIATDHYNGFPILVVIFSGLFSFCCPIILGQQKPLKKPGKTAPRLAASLVCLALFFIDWWVGLVFGVLAHILIFP